MRLQDKKQIPEKESVFDYKVTDLFMTPPQLQRLQLR